MVLETELAWMEELWTHPSCRTARGDRTRGSENSWVRDYCEESEVRQARVTIFVNQDVRLVSKCVRGGVNIDV